MLEVAGLQQYYGESHTLWDVDLSLQPGDCVGLLGRNGVGKTTLIKAIMGLLPVRAGRIVFDGKPLTRASSDERARVGVAYVPQGRQIFGQLTVEENLRIAGTCLHATRRGASLGSGKRGPIPDKIFRWFPVLREMLGRRGGDLSGGQQQQLAIGRALMLEPRLLILDEPTEGIQPNLVAQIGDVLDELARKEGLTVLAAEQKLGFVRRFARRFYVMDRGRTVAQGAIEALDEKLVQQYLTV